MWTLKPYAILNSTLWSSNIFCAIQKQLPSNLSVGTGFVMCSLGNGSDDITSQIYIIVYDNFNETIKKAHMNAELISRNYVPADMLFNGIFSYENDFNFDIRLSTTICE